MDRQLILDRYRPLADLGGGGAASVTLAFDTRMGRRVAVKRLPLPPGGAVERQAAGLAEARTAALLNRPEIVTVHEWDADAEEAFIIMEFVDGASLAEILDEAGALDADETAAVFSAVASALTFAHENGVLHLDIKPANVLVSREGHVKVADFGISALTVYGGLAGGGGGTLGYTAPEQLRAEDVDERTDEWALAALTYEMLADANPLDAGTVEAAIATAERADIPAASDLEPSVPEQADYVLLAALAPDAPERYATVAAFADALLPWLGDPAFGREKLAQTVRGLVAEEFEEEERAFRRLGMWDRAAPASGALTRLFAAAVCLWLAYLAFSPFSLGPVATWGASALVAAAAAIVPALGLVLALGALGVAAFRLGIAAGLIALAAGAALWFALGRKGRGDSLAVPASPLLAFAHAGPAAPMLLGFTFPPLAAGLASAGSAAVVMLASALSGNSSPLLLVDPRVLLDPWSPAGIAGRLGVLVAGAGPLVAVLAWGAAGAAVSLACGRGSRLMAALGVLLGTVIVLLGYGAWAALGPPLVWPSTTVLQHVSLSLILMAAVIALGPPVRGEPPESPSDETRTLGPS